MTVIYGIIIAISGLLSSFFGGIPGVFSIIIGSFLFKTGQDAKNVSKAARDSRDHIIYRANFLFKHYGYILLMTGILFIVALFIFSYFLIYSTT
ncbi:hypothetical protein HUG15_19715 [Salicibibacter cibarius]|uniref:Uncharacterized protein n=1 Tax=Salicibibacter cibarius TaxID=2743000 RepID=A0A7T6Z639_9BACI|nr:hypothetical protein HUG15_19715 [Salicibibacter cibarius]